jgi:hypothetical protein
MSEVAQTKTKCLFIPFDLDRIWRTKNWSAPLNSVYCPMVLVCYWMMVLPLFGGGFLVALTAMRPSIKNNLYFIFLLPILIYPSA